jgi:membrane associated rhomboid family serine protease
MLHTPSRVALAVALVVAFAVVWYLEGRGSWRARFRDRFVFGVPWGTLVTVAVVVGFYLVGQGGLRHWSSPVVYPFVTWSYLYPTGMLSAGIAHGSPGHLVGNMLGTLAFAPIAEYAWGHDPPSRRGRTRIGRRDAGGLLARPLVRALVVFPAVLLSAAVLTAGFAVGPGLGFSGAVFAIAGLAVVTYPVTTLLALVAASAVGTVYRAFAEPVVRAGIEAGGPSPPPWAAIAFQAHMLGFLVGVAVGAALLRRRNRRPALDRVFFATLGLGLVQALWLLVWVDEETFVLYRAAGVALVALLSVVVAAAAGGSHRPLPKPLSVLPRRPSRRQLAAVWLAVVVIGTAAAIAGLLVAGELVALGVGTLVVVAVVLAVPALPPLLPDSLIPSPVSRRWAAAATIAVAAVVVAAPAIPFGFVVVADDAGVPGSERVDVRDYGVAYGENVTAQRDTLVDFGNETEPVNVSGVVIRSSDRELWAVAVRGESLAFAGNDTVVLGGLGWRETVEVDRTGWTVPGNDSVYAVDLTHDGTTVRSYRSAPATADVLIDGRRIAVAPTDDGFELRVLRNGSTVGTAPIPAANGSTTVDDISMVTRVDEDTERVVAVADRTEVQVAARETYD